MSLRDLAPEAFDRRLPLARRQAALELAIGAQHTHLDGPAPLTHTHPDSGPGHRHAQERSAPPAARQVPRPRALPGHQLTVQERLELRRFEGSQMPTVVGTEGVTELGTVHVSGRDRLYVSLQDREYEALEAIDDLDLTPAGVSVFVNKRIGDLEAYLPLRLVTTGTYARLATPVATTSRPREVLDVARGVYRSLTRVRLYRAAPGAIAEYSPAALLTELRGKLDLELVGDRLLVRGAPVWVEEARRLERLLIAELGGAALSCDHGDGEPAWTILAINVAACQAHAS